MGLLVNLTYAKGLYHLRGGIVNSFLLLFFGPFLTLDLPQLWVGSVGVGVSLCRGFTLQLIHIIVTYCRCRERGSHDRPF